MIRILHVIGSMNCGGAETFLMNVYRNIDRSLIQFDFVVHTDKEGFYDEEIQMLGGKIYHTERYNVCNSHSYIHFWHELYKKHPEYRIVHGHINSSAFLYLSLAKRYGIVAIAHSHATSNTEKTIRAAAFRFFSYPVRFIADYFFACSKKAGLDRYGKRVVNSDHFCVLKNGIDSQKFVYNPRIREEMRKKFMINENDLIVGHVGRFTYAKNHTFILNVFKELKNRIPNSYLWLVGGGGELESLVVSEVKKHGLESCVMFAGITNNVSYYLQAFDVFIFPSLFEGLGISVIEAQAVGLPCVVSENIQEEAEIVDELFNRIQLSKGETEWAKTIVAVKDAKRISRTMELRSAGFDIHDTVELLQKFYILLAE